MLDNDVNFLFKIKCFSSIIVKEQLDSYRDSKFVY